jgi:hypothetical protein
MKARTYLFIIPMLLIVAFVVFRFCKSKPTGPVTPREFRSLTNAVQSVTIEPIVRIDRVDLETRMMVWTGSITNHHEYLFERTRFGWRYIPSLIVKP